MPYLCPPAILFIVFSVIFVIFTIIKSSYSIMYYLFSILFIVLWTWLLNYICLSGYTVVSWILVLLPLIFMILFIIFGIIVVKKSADILNTVIKESQVTQ